MRGRGLAFLAGRATARNQAAQPQSTAPYQDPDTELEKVVKMHDEGKLTDEEFAEAKTKILSSK